MKNCPVGRWVTLGDFFRYMIAAGYEFEVSRNPESLSLDSYGSLYDTSFLLLEARYILAFLFEYVSTLGLIDVAYIHPNDGVFNFQKDVNSDYYYNSCLSRYDGLAYFRITALGAYCLGLSERYIPTTATPKQILRILPNLEVVVCQELIVG